MAEEGLNFLVGLAVSFDLLLNLVDMAHKVINTKLAPHNHVLSASVGATLVSLFILVAHLASYVADFGMNGLGNKGLHIPHVDGLDKVHFGRVNDDRLGVWSGVFVVVGCDGLARWGGEWESPHPFLSWDIAEAGVHILNEYMITLNIRVGHVCAFLRCFHC